MATVIADNVAIDPQAEIDEDVQIGPFCVIGPKVRIGRGTKLENSVTLSGRVTIGSYNHLYPGVVLGAEPQDISYSGRETEVIVGDHNILRECVTIHRASEKEDGVTRIGDHNFLMACSHVAHDCKLGNNIILGNCVLLGGHVHIHDHATLSGGAAVHHYATIGAFAFVAGLSGVRLDVPPYMLVEGYPARPRCVNVVALKRKNFTAETIEALSQAHRLLFRAKVGLDQAREILASHNFICTEVNYLLDFLQEQHLGRHGRGRERRRAA
jgi:UDP-N-acetylglucosamine acyltransferase